VVRPLGELDLADELRLDPHDVALPDLGHLGHLAEGRVPSLERPQLREQPVDLLLGEAGAAVADPHELVAAAHREHERAEASCPPALALRVAGDDELLPAVRLDLEPLASPLTRLVERVGALGDHALEALLARRREERLPVVEAL